MAVVLLCAGVAFGVQEAVVEIWNDGKMKSKKRIEKQKLTAVPVGRHGRVIAHVRRIVREAFDIVGFSGIFTVA